jgi:hypothetical protein
VVGFENVMTAIRRVWASPFTERAYKWRQDRMERPEQIYVSVILMKSVPVEKSGVMVTADLETGDQDWLSIAVNEGLGGAVDGQAAEELRVHMVDGKTRFLEPAGERYKRVLLPEGGVTKINSTRTEGLLERGETDALVNLAKSLPNRFPMPHDEQGRPLPVDIEFGFLKGRLVLLQIRPFVQSLRARQSLFLKGLDQGLEGMGRQVMDLDRPQRVFP